MKLSLSKQHQLSCSELMMVDNTRHCWFQLELVLEQANHVVAEGLAPRLHQLESAQIVEAYYGS